MSEVMVVIDDSCTLDFLPEPAAPARQAPVPAPAARPAPRETNLPSRPFPQDDSTWLSPEGIEHINDTEEADVLEGGPWNETQARKALRCWYRANGWGYEDARFLAAELVSEAQGRR